MAALTGRIAECGSCRQSPLRAVVAKAPTGSSQLWAMVHVSFESRMRDIAPGMFGRTVAAAEDLPRS